MTRLLAGGIGIVACGVAIGWAGGYDPSAQWTVAGLAAVAAAAGSAASRIDRRVLPVLVPLLSLGAVAALSALWTIGDAATALRAGALAAAYGALALAAFVALGPRLVAAGIAVAALVCGLLGLLSVAATSTLFAERLEGGWRPEGPFGYGPALALLELSALPPLLCLATRARPALAGLASSGLAVAFGVLLLEANRTALGLGAALCALALAAPGATVGVHRRLAAAALVPGLAAAVAIRLVAGGWHGRRFHAAASAPWVVLAVVVAAGAIWPLLRRLPPLAPPRADAARPHRARGRRSLAAALALAGVAVAVGLGTAGALSDRRFPGHGGLTHGRTWIWRVAVTAALHRPLGGSGAGTFLQATFLEQPGHGRITGYAHDLPLEAAAELGVPGLLAALALYLGTGLVLVRTRRGEGLWLLGPAVVVFLASNLVDWTWHLAGAGAVFALAAGTLAAASSAHE